jgi:hypothetical protein
MWVCWTVMGLMMIITTRYLKAYPKFSLYTHIIVGSIIFILNLVYGLGAIAMKSFKVSETVHGILGTAFSCAMFLTTLIGGFAHFKLRDIRWKSIVL